MVKFFMETPLSFFLIASFTLGLAPFAPPHLWEKTVMLVNGKLVKPIDWFDFFMHLTPWVLLVIKLYFMATAKGESNSPS